MLSSPHLQAAYDKMMARRETNNVERVFDMPAVRQSRHSTLRVAYVRSGRLYLTLRYCTHCLLGYALDLVPDVPDDTPRAGDVGVKMTKDWQLECRSERSG